MVEPSDSGGLGLGGVTVPDWPPAGSDSKSDSSVMTKVGLTCPAPAAGLARAGSGEAVEPLSGVEVPRAW